MLYMAIKRIWTWN